MTALDDWITQLAGGKYSDNPQTLISTVATAIAALQLLQAGIGGSAAANLVFAGPTSGGPAPATFRALVTADLATTLLLSVGNINLNSTTKPASAGLFSPAANQLGVGINSAEVARFIAGGVQLGAGIGTAAVLNDYELGNWTPTDQSGAALTFSNVDCEFAKIGNFVFAQTFFTFPVTANGANCSIGGLPFTSANRNATQGMNPIGFVPSAGIFTKVALNGTTFPILNVASTVITNSGMSGLTVQGTIIYPTT